MPFPPVTAALAPAPKRKVEYGTGIIVSSAGHVVTDRQVIDGCQFITVAGLGSAEVLAEDKTSDLALHSCLWRARSRADRVRRRRRQEATT